MHSHLRSLYLRQVKGRKGGAVSSQYNEPFPFPENDVYLPIFTRKQERSPDHNRPPRPGGRAEHSRSKTTNIDQRWIICWITSESGNAMATARSESTEPSLLLLNHLVFISFCNQQPPSSSSGSYFRCDSQAWPGSSGEAPAVV